MSKLTFHERASLDRPAWTSEQSTGNWKAYKHKHVSRKDKPILKNYYCK